MTKRTLLNVLSLAVVAAGAPLALAPAEAAASTAAAGGTCCPAKSGICVLNLDGKIVTISPAFFQEAGKPCPPVVAEPVPVEPGPVGPIAADGVLIGD